MLKTIVLAAVAVVLTGCVSPAPAASETKPKPKVVARSKVAATVRGIASYYGRELHGRPTASGERFNMYALTAAHPSINPKAGARMRVTNLDNGRQVTVRINDKGPHTGGRVLDLSYGAAQKLGMVNRGTARIVGEIVR